MIETSTFRPALAVLLLSALAACQTAREFPAPGSHWKNAQGQLQYTTPKRSVIGETVLSGDPAHAHGRLASWAALREVFAALETRIDAPSATLRSAPGAAYPWTAQLTQTPGQPQRIRIEFPRTKERFTFVLMR